MNIVLKISYLKHSLRLFLQSKKLMKENLLTIYAGKLVFFPGSCKSLILIYC